MNAKWVIESDANGAILIVTRICGHTERLAYEDVRTAVCNADSKANEKCVECYHKEQQAQMGVWMTS